MERGEEQRVRQQSHSTLATSAVLVAVSLGVLVVSAGAVEGSAVDLTLEAIRSCMADTPAPWPEAWQREYIETIQQTIASDANAPDYATRLDILRRGFPTYWESLTKTEERALFEVHNAEMHWYIEHLMGTQLPSPEDKAKLRSQYAQLWDHAATGLLDQFPFLDPNAVQTAKDEHLAESFRAIDAPLLPIFQHSFSDKQINEMEQRWYDLRYARVDLWRQIAPAAAKIACKQEPPPLDPNHSRTLAQRSLVQLLDQIRAVGALAPDYYRAAVRSRIDSKSRALQSSSQASQVERDLDRQYWRQLLQTEQISFLLAALLEMPDHSQAQTSDANELTIQRGEPHEEQL